ncbi:MAG: hypothetical protein SGI92_26500 [Bryobacteraceae bacterium]|nr:hypothetical protein [Bryobacteraceae bacterium]
MQAKSQPLYARPLSTLPFILLGAVLIVLCARGDFWLDEIWSFEWATQSVAWWEILTIRHDNNHPLNTFWLWLTGPLAPPLAGRALSMVCGIGSLVLMDRIAARFDPAARIPAVCLAAFSFPLVLYFSEARGYGPAVFFSLACALILLHAPTRPRFIIAFTACSTLGILAHANFLFAFAGLGTWYLFNQIRTSPGLALAVQRTALLFVPALIPLAAFYFLFLTRLVSYGPDYSIPFMVAQTLGFALGLPASEPLVPLTLFLSALVLMAAFAAGFGAPVPGSPRVLALAMIVVVPLLTYPVALRSVSGFRFYPRSYLVCVPFLYLLLALAIAPLFRSPKPALRALAVFLLCLSVAGHARRLASLVTHGRGGYSQALASIAAASPNGAAIGSDHDFRNRMLFNFFQHRDPRLARLRYVANQDWPLDSPDWFILHVLTPEGGRPNPRIGVDGQVYEYWAHYTFTALSGWHWFIYRRR